MTWKAKGGKMRWVTYKALYRKKHYIEDLHHRNLRAVEKRNAEFLTQPDAEIVVGVDAAGKKIYAAVQFVKKPKRDRTGPHLIAAQEQLRELLADHEWHTSVEMTAAVKAVVEGCSQNHLQRARKRLGVESRKAGLTAGWEWRLPA